MIPARANTARVTPTDLLVPNPKLRLREQLREVMRFKHYALRTEETYWSWCRQFIVFHGKKHPREMGAGEVHQFLTHLAAEKNVAVSTQNQALNALVFLYAQVLHRPLGQLDEFVRPSRPPRVPVVLTQAEARRLLAVVAPPHSLLARLLYGTGMRERDLIRARRSLAPPALGPPPCGGITCRKKMCNGPSRRRHVVRAW